MAHGGDDQPGAGPQAAPSPRSAENLNHAWHAARDALTAGEYERAKSLAGQVHADACEMPALRSQAALLLAKVCWNSTEGAEGLGWAESALTEARRADDQTLEAEAWGVMGSCHALLEQGGQCVLALERAITLLPASAPPQVQASLLTGVGLSYHELGLPVSALPPLRRAFEIDRDSPLSGRAMRVAVNLMQSSVVAWRLLETTEPQHAKEILDEALALLPWLEAQMTSVGSRHAGFAYRDTAAQVLWAAGERERARDLLGECLALGPQEGWQHRRDWLIDLARIEHELDQHERAAEHAAQARQLIDAHPGERVTPEDLRRRATLTALEGDSFGALRWHHRFHARVVRNEQSALEAKVAELGLMLTHRTLEREVADLREQQSGLKDRYLQMQSLARIDPLTGLLNRRAFEEEFTKTGQRQAHLGMFDLDHFKGVNDQFGHQVGDDVLREVARLMVDTMRDRDRLCRYGGEEFAILLVEGGAGGAAGPMHRLHRAVQAHDWQRLQPGLKLTLSAGVVAVTPGTTLTDAIGQADALLYRAKAQGRNRVLIDEAPIARQVDR